MHMKIKELAEQATQKYDRLGSEIPFAQPDLEVFAKLIVKECTDFLKDVLDDYFAAEQLEEHFEELK